MFAIFAVFVSERHRLFAGHLLFRRIEEQQKKALEEDPTVFDYDGVYDKIKEKVARPLILDREERKVTKKDFLLDFYTILDKNVAYCAQDPRGRKHENRVEKRTAETCESGSQGNR
ncbi:Coiled-coil domain-containing protein [Arachis hypogaea]|nr:Coiled-coil domain-containing protein [Arachis hypogaea]